MYDLQHLIYSFCRLKEPVKDRKLLQFLGTDWGRELSPTLWIDLWRMDTRSQMFKKSHVPVVVLNDDCRFPNEAKLVHELGGTIIEIKANREIRVKRGELIGEDHLSEQGVGDDQIDVTVENEGTKWDLNLKLKSLMNQL